MSMVVYTIREAFYNSDDEICAVTENNPPIGVYADDEHFPPDEERPTEKYILSQMSETISRFEQAMKKPIVDLDSIEYGKWD
jgi:hypothetical protein